jgi:hypothetical protein
VFQEYVASMENSAAHTNADETFSFLAKKFLSRGISDYRLADSAEKHEYKEGKTGRALKLIVLPPNKGQMAIKKKRQRIKFQNFFRKIFS